MNWSLNEIEALSRKAARGAGYSWGLAEEAGYAVRWLSARGLPGPRSLATLLAWGDGRSPQDMRPRLDGNRWSATAEAVCPIIAGCMLSDHCELMNLDDLAIGPVREPLLLLPFAAQAAKRTGRAVTLAWGSCRVTLGAGGQLACQGDIAAPQTDLMMLSVSSVQPTAEPILGFRAKADAHTIELLDRFAARTYAPASEESRLAGAGAGLSDND